MNIIHESDGFSQARRDLKAQMEEKNVLEYFDATWQIVRDVKDLEVVRHRFSPGAFRMIQEIQRQYQEEKSQGFGFYEESEGVNK